MTTPQTYARTRPRASFEFHGIRFEVHAARNPGGRAIKGAWAMLYNRHELRGTDWAWYDHPGNAALAFQERLRRSCGQLSDAEFLAKVESCIA